MPAQSIFDLPEKVTDLNKLYGDVTNAKYVRVSATRNIQQDAFPSSDIHLKFNVSGKRWWKPKASYLRMRVRLSEFPEGGLEMRDGVAPDQNMMASLFSSAEFLINDVTVAKVSNHLAKICAVKTRLTEDCCWFEAQKRDNIWDSEFSSRLATTAFDGIVRDTTQSIYGYEGAPSAVRGIGGFFDAPAAATSNTLEYDDLTQTITFTAKAPDVIKDELYVMYILAHGTTTNGFTILATTTQTVLSATSTGGKMEFLDGRDILFTNGTDCNTDSGTKLPFEIEKYASSTGELVAWIEADDVSSTTAKSLLLYYGNSTATDQQNITGVWDSTYAGVWHLNEDPSGGAPQHSDSTSNNNDGTAQSMESGDSVTGPMDKALNFDPSEYVQIPNSASLDITGNAITLSVWVKADIAPDDDNGFLTKYIGGNYNYMISASSSDVSNCVSFIPI